MGGVSGGDGSGGMLGRLKGCVVRHWVMLMAGALITVLKGVMYSVQCFVFGVLLTVTERIRRLLSFSRRRSRCLM